MGENSRTELATVRISRDSLIARFTIREDLSGQYSTLLRPLYLKEYIDSTLSPDYFKKCVDKPGATAKKIKLASRSAMAPYRYVFDCSAAVPFKDTNSISLANWFSFNLSGHSIAERPQQDFYVDFIHTDSYTFSLDFDKPVEIQNGDRFARKMNNDFFELESGIIKKTPNSYQLSVRLAMKHPVIPKEDLSVLMELIKHLDELNTFSLELKR